MTLFWIGICAGYVALAIGLVGLLYHLSSSAPLESELWKEDDDR